MWQSLPTNLSTVPWRTVLCSNYFTNLTTVPCRTALCSNHYPLICQFIILCTSGSQAFFISLSMLSMLPEYHYTPKCIPPFYIFIVFISIISFTGVRSKANPGHHHTNPLSFNILMKLILLVVHSLKLSVHLSVIL